MSRRRSTEPARSSGAASGTAIFRLLRPAGLSNFEARFCYGAIAQLGERYNGIVEVTGSIPVGSTILLKGLERNR